MRPTQTLADRFRPWRHCLAVITDMAPRAAETKLNDSQQQLRNVILIRVPDPRTSPAKLTYNRDANGCSFICQSRCFKTELEKSTELIMRAEELRRPRQEGRRRPSARLAALRRPLLLPARRRGAVPSSAAAAPGRACPCATSREQPSSGSLPRCNSTPSCRAWGAHILRRQVQQVGRASDRRRCNPGHLRYCALQL